MASKKASLGDLLSKILIWMLSMEVRKGICLLIGEGPCLWVCHVTKIVTTAAAAPAHRSSSSNAMATPREGAGGQGGTCKVQPSPDRPHKSCSFTNFRNQQMSKIGREKDRLQEKSSCWPGSAFPSCFCCCVFSVTDWHLESETFDENGLPKAHTKP